jgi:hypothetical protein
MIVHFRFKHVRLLIHRYLLLTLLGNHNRLSRLHRSGYLTRRSIRDGCAGHASSN